MNLLINIPLFVLALKLLGKKSLYLSLLGTFSVSAWMAIFEAMPLSHHYHHFIFTAFKGDILLACIASGVVLGLGLGIIFNAGELREELISSLASLTNTLPSPWENSC